MCMRTPAVKHGMEMLEFAHQTSSDVVKSARELNTTPQAGFGVGDEYSLRTSHTDPERFISMETFPTVAAERCTEQEHSLVGVIACVVMEPADPYNQ